MSFQLDANHLQSLSLIISNTLMLLVVVSILASGVINKINVYQYFIEGAKEGFQIAVRIIPYLVAILVGIGMLRVSGALDILVSMIAYTFRYVGIYGDYVYSLPVAFMKPLSGSGARGMMIDICNSYGVDSLVGRLASIMQGSTDTTFYIIALYFGSVNISRFRHAIGCGLFADIIGIIAAILIGYIFFS